MNLFSFFLYFIYLYHVVHTLNITSSPSSSSSSSSSTSSTSSAVLSKVTNISSPSSSTKATTTSTRYPNITIAPTLKLNHCLNGIRKRQEFRTLDKAQWRLFIQAILNLQKGATPTPYDSLAKMHVDIAPETHKFPLFFPWHRGFLAHFERILQQYDSSIMSPYWEWTFDNQAPDLSPIFQDDYMGGNGNGNQSCVTDGPFNRWNPAYPTYGCLRRQFVSNHTNQISASYPTEVTSFLLDKATNYVELWAGFEGPIHNYIHVNIGGHMIFKNSVSDPIFWLVHGYVDKVWWKWQQLHPQSAFDYGGHNLDGSLVSLSDTLFTFSDSKVKDVMNTTALCYEYKEFIPPALPKSIPSSDDLTDYFYIREEPLSASPRSINISKDDRTNLLALRTPDKLPATFIKSMNTTGKLIDYFENTYREVIWGLNQRPDFISACSLLRKPDFLFRLVMKGGNFKIFMAESVRRQKQVIVLVKKKDGLKPKHFEHLSSLLLEKYL